MIDATKLKKIQDCKGRYKEIIGDEDCLKLAHDGILPHYVIINPITKEQSLYFVASEINDWFNSNFIKYNEGYFPQSFHFHFFDKEQHQPTGDIPEELNKISDLYELPMSIINTPPGVYFLCADKVIVYIGQAVNISNRINAHIAQGLKSFNRVFFIPCPINRLNQLESSLIRYFKPPLNKTSIKTLTLHDENILKLIKQD